MSEPQLNDPLAEAAFRAFERRIMAADIPCMPWEELPEEYVLAWSAAATAVAAAIAGGA